MKVSRTREEIMCIIKGTKLQDVRMKNTFLMIIFLLISTSSFSNENNDELDLYDWGDELSRCSGVYEFASLIYGEVFKDSAVSKTLHEHSNGWLTAGYANYFFSGLTQDAALISSKGKKETTITQWLANLEQLNMGNEEEFTALLAEMAKKIRHCSSYDDYVVTSQKLLKQAKFSRPKVEIINE